MAIVTLAYTKYNNNTMHIAQPLILPFKDKPPSGKIFLFEIILYSIYKKVLSMIYLYKLTLGTNYLKKTGKLSWYHNHLQKKLFFLWFFNLDPLIQHLNYVLNKIQPPVPTILLPSTHLISIHTLKIKMAEK